MKKTLLKKVLFVSFYLTAFSVFASDTADFIEAAKLKSNGQYSQANYYYYKAIDERVNVEEALYQLSDSFYQAGNFEQASNNLALLLQKTAGHSQGLLLRSRIYIHQKQYSNALVDLQQLEKTDPSANVYRLLDSVYNAIGDKPLAEKSKNKYQELIKQEQAELKDK